MTNFKTSTPPFCVDVVNVGSLMGNNFKKQKVMERSETSKVKSFISICNSFFICSTKENIHDKIKKQNVLHD